MKLEESIDYKEYLEVYNEALAHNPECRKIDEEFTKLMNMIKIEKGYKKDKIHSFRFNKNWEKCFVNIEKSIDKMFNIDSELFVDIDHKEGLTYCACIFLTEDDYRKIAEEILENGEGYYFKTIRKCRIYFQELLFFYLKMENMDPRILTAILLHEIGHKVFLKVNTQILRREAWIDLTFTIGTITFMITFLAISVPAVIITSFILYWILLFIYQFYKEKNIAYIKTESNCDSMAVKYGYGDHIFAFFTKLVEESIGKGTIHDREYRYNSSLNRLENIKKDIYKEMNDPKTSAKDKKYLEEQLAVINDMEQNRINPKKYKKIDSLLTNPKSKLNQFIQSFSPGNIRRNNTIAGNLIREDFDTENFNSFNEEFEKFLVEELLIEF